MQPLDVGGVGGQVEASLRVKQTPNLTVWAVPGAHGRRYVIDDLSTVGQKMKFIKQTR